jgi:hypothetical protein
MGEHICTICHRPALPEQGIYSISGNHWDCETRGEKDLDAAFEQLSSIVGARKSPVKAGTGKTATKLKAMIMEALAAENPGAAITDIDLWIQAPAYRGPRWDLAGWGGVAKIDGRPATFHSWATMTACVKSGGVRLWLEDVRTWDIGPAKQ